MSYFKSTMSPEERARIVELAKAGKTGEEVAKILGYTYPHMIANSGGIFGRLLEQRRVERDAQILSLYLQGLNMREIAKRLGIGYGCVRHNLQKQLPGE